MPDREKVLEGLGKVWDAFNQMEHELYADYVFDAMELIKGQAAEAEKPDNRNDDYTWICSKCKGMLFRGNSTRDNYCSTCGRLVLWDG